MEMVGDQMCYIPCNFCSIILAVEKPKNILYFKICFSYVIDWLCAHRYPSSFFISFDIFHLFSFFKERTTKAASLDSEIRVFFGAIQSLMSTSSIKASLFSFFSHPKYFIQIKFIMIHQQPMITAKY